MPEVCWSTSTSEPARTLTAPRCIVRSLATLVNYSLTNTLTHSRLVDLIDVTQACEDANSKLVEIVADIDAKDRVGNSLLQIWELRFGHKAKLLFRL